MIGASSWLKNRKYITPVYAKAITSQMQRFSILALIIAVFLFISGCATTIMAILPKEAKLQDEARWGEMVKYLENKIENPEEVSGWNLYCLCEAYANVKNYKKLFTCLDYLDRKIEKGDYTFVGYDFRPGPSLFRSEAFIDLGDYPKAIKETQIAHDLSKNISTVDFLGLPDPANMVAYLIPSLGAMGVAYALNGEYKQAKRCIDRLEEIKDPGGWVRGSGIVAVGPYKKKKYINIAKIYLALGDYQMSLDAIKRARNRDDELEDFLMPLLSLDFLVGGGLKVYWSELPRQFLLGKLLLENGDVETAKKAFDKLLELPQISANGEIYWMLLFDRGRIAEMERDDKHAIEMYTHAIEVIESQRSSINTEASKIGFVGNKQDVYDRLVRLLFAHERYEEAFQYVERAKARALVDMLAARERFAKTDVHNQNTSDLIAKLDTAEQEAKLQDETITADQSGKQRAIVIKLKDEIRNADPELASFVTVTALDVAKIQQLLPPNETLIEYFGAGDTLFAFIVNHKEVRGVKLEVKGLRRDVEVFRENIMISNSNQFKADGRALYEKLFQPMEKLIESKNLTIVPHGELHYLPFYALQDKDVFLIDRYNIRILPSASVMTFLKDPPEGHAGNLLAFGNPDLGNSTYDLPGAQYEAITIAKDQPKSKLLLRSQATETAVKRFGQQFRYIHFATHGTFDAEKPLSSGLLMAGDVENDGTLTVGELYDLHLPVDLVTLSACETALGKVANGDDVVGFTRGFLYAGVSSIVSSLWKVDDQATSILMQKFYRSLKVSDKRRALRTAQLKVKSTYNAHPYYWAGFQITGSFQ
jgi:CHAT domain-containing protein